LFDSISSGFHRRFQALSRFSRKMASPLLVHLVQTGLMISCGAVDHVFTMLPHALGQVAGNADVERAVAVTCKDMDGSCFDMRFNEAGSLLSQGLMTT
jgi:hypothetical protein